MAVFKYSMAEVAANLKSVRDKISYAAAKRASVIFSIFSTYYKLNIQVIIF